MPTPDFSKIWASASPLPAYTFTDEDYTTGWDFVGSAPPTKNQFDAWFKYVDERLKWLYDKLMTSLYPVGSVYISFDSTDPSTIFGGTWERLKDRFLLASGDAYAPNTTGGSATKTLTTSNLPAHTHTCGSAGAHTHTRGTMNITAGGFMGESTEIGGNYEKFMKQASGALYWGSPGSYGSNGGIDKDDYIGYFDASRSWTGATSSNGAHTHTIGSTGSALPLNIMPPYQTVYMWRRTA